MVFRNVLAGFEEKVRELQKYLWEHPGESHPPSNSESLAPSQSVDNASPLRKRGKAGQLESIRESSPSVGGDRENEADLPKGAFMTSVKAMSYPWHAFKQGSSVITILWLFGFVYSIVVLTGNRWRWPDTNSYGLGERRRLSAVQTAMHREESRNDQLSIVQNSFSSVTSWRSNFRRKF